MKLRPYQEDIIERVRSEMRAGTRKILICAPTGSGKTALTAHMLKAAAEKGMRSWFMVHRRELIEQSITAFDNIKIRFGVSSAGYISEPDPLVQICSVQSMRTRHSGLKKPKLIVWDECHHCGAKTWEDIFNYYSDSFHIGLTATPVRTDGKGLGKFFDTIIEGPSVSDLIDMEYLSPYKLYAPNNPDLSGVHTRMGDFVKSELVEAMNKPTITGSAIKEYRRHADGKRAVVFCVSVQHAESVCDEFNRKGIRAEILHGKLDRYERDATIDRFRCGETPILVTIDIVSEGFDIPAMECAILLRPTHSLGLYLQQVGRVLRIFPGKENAIILDHAGNAGKHGLPDESREWSLAGRERRVQKKDTGPSIKICTSCFAAQQSGSTVCKFCGYSFPTKPRKIEEVDGELVEVDPTKLRMKRKQEQGMARTRDELLALAKQRGYKNPHGWVHMIMQSRQRKKLRGGTR